MQEYLNSVYASPYGKLKQKLIDNDYIRIVFEEHCLYDDELWVHPDTIKAHLDGTDNPKWIFVFKDKYLGPQSSTETVRRNRKLYLWQLKLLGEHLTR